MKNIRLKNIIPVGKVNISSSFAVRTRCSICKTGPFWYFYIGRSFVWKNVRNLLASSKEYRTWFVRMNNDWYLSSNPSLFHGIKDFSFVLDDNKYSAALHKTRGVNDDLASYSHSAFPLEKVACECGSTVWAFNQKSDQSRPETKNRKGRYFYPKKLEF